MNKNMQIGLAVLLALILIGVAILYWTTPAGSLPTYVPGYAEGSSAIHFKHGLASVILALGVLVFAWFASGQRKS